MRLNNDDSANKERSQGAASTVPDGIMKIVVTGAQEDPASITWLLGYSDYQITITFSSCEGKTGTIRGR
jgi:hypothetical protein